MDRILVFYLDVVTKARDLGLTTLREKEAIDKINPKNEFEVALNILRDKNRINELKQAESFQENRTENLAGFIHEDRMRIFLLKAKGDDPNTIPEIYECYEEAVKVAEKYFVETIVVYEYGRFLCEQNDYNKALEKLEWLRLHHMLEKDKTFADIIVKGKYYMVLALALGNTQKYRQAVEIGKKAIEIWETKVIEEEQKGKLLTNYYDYAGCLAACYHNLANTFTNTRRYTEAEELYRKAIDIWDFRDDDGVMVPIYVPDNFDSNLAQAFINLSKVLSITNRFDDEAEYMCEVAVKTLKYLEKDNPGEYTEQLADSYYQTSILYDNNNLPAKARKNCREAIAIWEKLAEKDLVAYGSKLVTCYNCLSRLYKKGGQHKRSEEVFRKSLEISKLMEK